MIVDGGVNKYMVFLVMFFFFVVVFIRAEVGRFSSGRWERRGRFIFFWWRGWVEFGED